jgi:hypothetical protein
MSQKPEAIDVSVSHRKGQAVSGVAGATSGIGLIGLANILPDGHWKPALIWISPVVSVAIGLLWSMALGQLRFWLTRRQLEKGIKIFDEMVRRVDEGASDEVRRQIHEKRNILQKRLVEYVAWQAMTPWWDEPGITHRHRSHE